MRALIIEDDPGIRDAICKHLRMECFAVDGAKDGAEGSYLARTNSYDIIILDNILPEKPGLLVCEEIRSTGHEMPILVLSVFADTKQKVQFINAGADDYMIKPFSYDELSARIRALMRRPVKLESDILTLGDLVINTKQQSVKRKGKHVYLTRKEYMLLEYLMRNVGNVLSRAMIMEHVWDMSSDPFSNTIESHVLSLRKKIGDTSKYRMIKTISGRGYKIEV